MNYRKLTAALSGLYDAREAQAIARLVMEERYGLTLTDLAMGRDDSLSLLERKDLEIIASRLAKGCPVQHILGYAPFCGRRFEVNADVLIPRPETEAMPRLVAEAMPRLVAEAAGSSTKDAADGMPRRILDIGTGSGCIAITLALQYPQASVTAIDISSAALATAQRNAHSLGAANVTFVCHDALHTDTLLQVLAQQAPPRFDIIVSNPPYVMQSEAAGMHPNVVGHEPATALFVPDDDPLRFYRAIAATAEATLTDSGIAVVETNAAMPDATAQLFTARGFDTDIRDDCYGRRRFVVARRRHT